MHRLLPGAVIGVLSLLLTTPLAFGRGVPGGRHVGFRGHLVAGHPGGYPRLHRGYGHGSYPPYGYGMGYLLGGNPYSGYLTGAAAVTRANADWLVKVQDARLKREKARQASVDTRRKIFEELMWEQKMRPTWNDIQEKEQAARLRHFRNTASPTDVWSATALNGILETVAREQARGAKGPTVPISGIILKRINLTSGASRGNIGLLKDDGKLSWPIQLEAAPFTKAREALSREIKDAVQQAKFGNRIEAGKISAMYDYLKELNSALHAEVNSMSPSSYIRAQRYLNQVRDAIRALESPDVVKYFNHDWEAKGTTVAELVKHMADKGLRFAPATAGDEDAYTALFNKLRAYDDGVTPTKPKYYTGSPEGVSSPGEK